MNINKEEEKRRQRSKVGLRQRRPDSIVIASLVAIVVSLVMFSAFSQLSASSAFSYNPLTVSSSSSACQVNSSGQEQEFMYTLAVSSTDHSKAYAITGADITRNVVGTSNKIYLLIHVHPASTFAVSSSGTTASCSMNYAKATNNIYWDASSLSTGRTFGTVGGDVSVDTSSGLLLVNQYVDKNHYPGQTVSSGPSSSTGPASCFIDTLGQERNSIYMLFVDDSTGRSYVIAGSSVVEKSSGGVTSTFYYVYLTSTPMNINRSGLNAHCTTILSQPTSEFEWVVRAPPPNNSIPGNYRIYGSIGGSLSLFSVTNAGVLDQFMDPNYQF
ncbi:MAG: hypothetical protein ACRDF4_01535 [Rhabdochlamydiaceae bacterium]